MNRSAPIRRFLPRRLALALLAAVTLSAGPARAEAPAVIASIKPIHSLVAGVMAGVGAPHLLIGGAASPHAFALKPSDARRLQNARVIFWTGEALETFLDRPLKSLSGRAAVIELMDATGVRHLPARAAGVHGHDDGHGHGHTAIDPHIWLDTRNAVAMTRAIAAALSRADPANGPAYRANAATQVARLQALDRALAARIGKMTPRPYVVFHDAYQYFEKRFGLAATAAITVAPDRPPGARRLIEIRDAIRHAKAACIFIEPQFTPRIAETVAEGTGAAIHVLDPLGAEIPAGIDAYDTLMTRLAQSFESCFAPG